MTSDERDSCTMAQAVRPNTRLHASRSRRVITATNATSTASGKTYRTSL